MVARKYDLPVLVPFWSSSLNSDIWLDVGRVISIAQPSRSETEQVRILMEVPDGTRAYLFDENAHRAANRIQEALEEAEKCPMEQNLPGKS